MQFQNYKFRPSSIGKIMTGFDTPNLTEVMERDLSELLEKVKLTEAQAKKRDELIKRRDAEKQLSAGAITYVHDLVDQIYYDYKDFITSKYFDKGIICEQMAIDYLNTNLFTNYTKFPEGTYENDFLVSKGCDIKDGRIIRDIKNAWSKKTMPRFKSEILSHDYKWQGIAYMYLFDAEEFHLDYVLMPTPENLIGYENKDLHNVENLAFEKRYKTASFKRDPAMEKLIEQAVKLARVEMNNYFDLLIND
jgi:hypothetical protein